LGAGGGLRRDREREPLREASRTVRIHCHCVGLSVPFVAAQLNPERGCRLCSVRMCFLIVGNAYQWCEAPAPHPEHSTRLLIPYYLSSKPRPPPQLSYTGFGRLVPYFDRLVLRTFTPAQSYLQVSAHWVAA